MNRQTRRTSIQIRFAPLFVIGLAAALFAGFGTSLADLNGSQVDGQGYPSGYAAARDGMKNAFYAAVQNGNWLPQTH